MFWGIPECLARFHPYPNSDCNGNRVCNFFSYSLRCCQRQGRLRSSKLLVTYLVTSECWHWGKNIFELLLTILDHLLIESLIYNNIKPVIQAKSVAFRIQQYFSLSVRSSKGRPSESLAVQFFYRCRHDAIRKKKKIKSYERHVKGRKSFRRQWRLRARFKWLWKVDNCVAAS